MRRKLSLILVALVAIFGLQIIPAFGQDAAPVPAILTLPDQIAGGRDVTISVTEKPSADQPEALAQWEAQVERFNALYPNVTVEGLEMQYDPAAFTALIAGDQLPTLFRTYFTEPGKFIDQGVVADLTPYFETAGVMDVFNPEILAIVSQDGKIYGTPRDAYALGLGYNIEMLKEAGYDAPPATWDELVEMAVKLTNADANVAGFAFINDGSGAAGWHFTNIAYSFGAAPEDIIRHNDDGTFTAAYGEGAPVEALQFIKDLRWTHNVLPGATLNWGSISEALISERVAMVIYAGDQFNYDYTQFPDADFSKFGYAAAPAGPNGRITLTGGNLWMVSGKASANEQEAAAYFQLWRQFDPVELQTAIEATTEAIGMPTLPLYVGDYQAQWEAFRAPYNKLPVENYAPFNEAVKTGEVHLQPEASPAVQDYYAEVGVVLSEVLSSEDVDVAARLAQSAEEFQAFVLDEQ
ncbi:MAG TPA: extracellular solute-binding protein [Phototrophicaceae bacterium]|nr:extracellular solute-binding protein [Phototrophicaceae bacterium]